MKGWMSDYGYIVAIRIMYIKYLRNINITSCLWRRSSFLLSSFLLTFLLLLTLLLFIYLLLLLLLLLIITYSFDFDGHIIICSLRAARSLEEYDFPDIFLFYTDKYNLR